MISTNDFRSGLKIEIDGEPYSIVEFQHVKPGKGGAFVRTKLKNLRTGNSIDKTFRSGEKFEDPDIEEREVQCLYSTEQEFYFMDVSTYEQLSFPAGQLGESREFFKENIVVTLFLFRGKPLSVELPLFVELTVVQTAPGIRGDTAAGGSKPATLETGAIVKVPFHIDEGDIVRIDTRTRTYVERVK